MAYSGAMNGAAQELAVNEIVARVFQQVIPAGNRVWLQEGLKVSINKDHLSMTTHIRVMYTPTTMVVPAEKIAVDWCIDERQFDALMKGQIDMLDTNALKDFFLKMLMVYAIEPLEYTTADKWGRP